MKAVKCVILALVFFCLALFVFFTLKSEKALLAHPKGIIAAKELDCLITQIKLMLIVMVPAILFLLFAAFRREKKIALSKFSSHLIASLVWIIPSIIIAAMIFVTWKAAHLLDPYRPIESEKESVKIEVVALNWKWLFIYPEEEIATVNFVQFPEKRSIEFSLAADESPMNSFWIPSLSGQIYAMTGMVTKLYVMADGSSEYLGRAAEINGDGFSKMTFVAKSTSQEEFNDWVKKCKSASRRLDESSYRKLATPSINHPVEIYSHVEKDLFHKIVMEY